VENIWARAVQMDTIENAALQFEMDYDSSTNKPTTDALPKINNIHIDDIKISGGKTKYLIKINGLLEKPLENVTISNVTAKSEKGIVLGNARQINLKNIQFSANKKPYFQLTNVQELNLENATCKKNDTTCVKTN